MRKAGRYSMLYQRTISAPLWGQLFTEAGNARWQVDSISSFAQSLPMMHRSVKKTLRLMLFYFLFFHFNS